jgi:hypothetical protein
MERESRMPEGAYVLAGLLYTHGPGLISDTSRLRVLLTEAMKGAPEASQLIAAAEEGIPTQILVSGRDRSGRERRRLIRRLVQARGMSASDAASTVDAWASALRVDLGGTRAFASMGFDEPPVPDVHVGDHGDGDAPSRWLWLRILGVVVSGGVLAAAIAFAVFVSPYGLEALFGRAGRASTWTPPAHASASAAASGGPASPSASASLTPLQTLLAWIPARVRESCSSSNYGDYGRPEAQVRCDLRGMAQLSYLRYETGAAMRAEYGRFVERIRDEGNCSAGNLPSEGSWSRPRAGHGRYTCFWSGGRPWIVWTADQANILAFAARDDGKVRALWDVWAAPPGEGPGPLAER